MYENDFLMTTDEVAKYLHVSKRHIPELRKQGLVSIKLGRSIRFRLDDVEAFLDSKRSEKRAADIVELDEKNRPVVAAAYAYTAENGERLIRFRCPFCGRIHYHGGGRALGDGDGWRVPHCKHGEAPNGYVLQESYDKEDAGDLDESL